MNSHSMSPPDLRLFWWVSRGSLSWPGLPLHFSTSFRKTGREIHLDLDSHRVCLHGGAIQKTSRATFCIIQMWFQAFPFFSEASPCVASLAVHHPETRTPAFPAVLLNICTLTQKWPLLLPIEQGCPLLQDEKIITVSHSWVVQLHKIIVFQ